MTALPGTNQTTDLSTRQLPPVAQLAVASMALVIVSGIYLAAHLPRHPPLGPAVGLLAGAGVLLVADVAVVSRLHPFNWEVFFRVGGWALLAYGVIAGMLEFIFVFDHTRGGSLVVFTLSLLVFALDVPLLLAFSVARYQEIGPTPTIWQGFDHSRSGTRGPESDPELRQVAARSDPAPPVPARGCTQR